MISDSVKETIFLNPSQLILNESKTVYNSKRAEIKYNSKRAEINIQDSRKLNSKLREFHLES